MLDDLFKGGNIITGLALGVGAVILTPVVVPMLRPLTKAVIRAGLIGFQEANVAFSELNKTAGEIFAEARTEMAQNGNGAARRAGPRVRSRRRAEVVAVAAVKRIRRVPKQA